MLRPAENIHNVRLICLWSHRGGDTTFGNTLQKAFGEEWKLCQPVQVPLKFKMYCFYLTKRIMIGNTDRRQLLCYVINWNVIYSN